MERLGSDIATEYAVYQGVKKNLDDMRAAGTGKEKMKAGWLAARAAGRKVFEKTLVWVERMNQAGENAMRLAAYQAMVESGKTRNEAASLAKNSTVNFNRKGELGKQANALYLFFNAGVQGTAAIAHAHMKGKYKGQARALSASLVALGYAASLLAARLRALGAAELLGEESGGPQDAYRPPEPFELPHSGMSFSVSSRKPAEPAALAVPDIILTPALLRPHKGDARAFVLERAAAERTPKKQGGQHTQSVLK
jgi:hypothetical protein